MPEASERIADIFKATGQPTVTYVKRDSGSLERKLKSAIEESGQLCLITGPSKTGKTTLYREVISNIGKEPLIVRCDKKTKCDDIWKKALEAVDFDRIESISTQKTSKISGELEGSGAFGWKWLANTAIRIKGTIARDTGETDIKKKILSEAGPDLLIPILKETNYVLVIEDFHYLNDDEKILLFQQWKGFIDEEVSVLVLGTTHRAVDIANSNKDLIGRIAQIDVGHWECPDLEAICIQGFGHLEQRISKSLIRKIAEEAVGLPIVVQQICLSIFQSKNIATVQQARQSNFRITEDILLSCMHDTANTKYLQFASHYATLIRGPKEKTRKYNTYELVIACFTLNPIKFSLTRSEINERLKKLPLENQKPPPAASLNSTLGALKTFQETRGFELIEWIQNENKLYIIEPSFLFYVRWRAKHNATPTQLDLFEALLIRQE
ncbi:hypothetical protein FBZ87_104531 [Nitrospirillum amazonense]|uniref:AAA domain-containing protein n=1 Tax=Nitrospirillum amazonense TaxID=28077 RepID=A0A560JWE4_9PROT|nr:ATP-binding protein [Nitrospirillum amazonense]TWB75425.1 hypothetical protein FBZ87_104531 [Nitrospirillum amazonense]